MQKTDLLQKLNHQRPHPAFTQKSNPPAPLPERPIPEIGDTLKNLERSAAPFLTPRQKLSHQVFIKMAHSILEPAQKSLKKNSVGWSDQALQRYYLTNRKSLAFYSNVFYLMEDDPECSNGLDRASFIIRAALEFYVALKFGKMTPDTFKGVSWGTDPYHALFSTFRCPLSHEDQVISQFQNRHIVISYRGGFYEVDFFKTWPASKSQESSLSENAEGQVPAEDLPSICSASEIRNTLKRIIQTGGADAEVGVLTTLPREHWAKAREELLKNSVNQKSLNCLESSLLVIALDLESFPQDRTESMWMLAHDHPENRWYDKSHQLIISGNGKAGLNRDHTAVDGNPTTRYIAEVCLRAQELCRESVRNSKINPLGSPGLALPCFDEDPIIPFKTLRWELNSGLREDIQNAIELSNGERQNRELLVFDFMELGETFFQNQNLSSDTAIQIIIQLAAYLTLGKLTSVNEAVNMRHFDRGRYDTIFCVTEESKKFILKAKIQIQTAFQATLQNALPCLDSLPELKSLFQNAVQSHKALVKDCKLGKSPYLHLTALIGLQKESQHLKLSWTGIELCSPQNKPLSHWEDLGFSKVMNSQVTTTNPGIRPGLEMTGFTDTAPDVIGLAYLVDSERIRIFIKTDHVHFGKAEAIRKNLMVSLQLLKRILA